jgi:hypothetical protein
MGGVMLVAIKSCEAHMDRANAQYKTWAAGHVPVIWFTGPMLSVPDDYAHLPEKVHEILKLLRYSDAALLADTDTYCVIPRLLAYKPEYDYIGYALEAEGFKYASGGAGYLLLRRAINILADAKWEGISRNEDMCVGKILADKGITVHHEPRFALYESPLPDNEIISQHLSSREAFQISFMYDAHKRMYP